MNFLSFFLIVACSLALSMCAGSKKEQAAEQADAVENDSVSTPMPAAPLPMAPGTARITATVLSTTAASSGYVCTMRVVEVHGYGSSTPPIPPGAELDIRFSEAVLGQLQSPKTVDTFLNPENTVSITVKHAELSKLMERSSPSWQAITIQ